MLGIRRIQGVGQDFRFANQHRKVTYLADEIFLNLICAYESNQALRGQVRQLTPPQELPVILNVALESGMNIHIVDDGVQDFVDVEPFALAERHYY